MYPTTDASACPLWYRVRSASCLASVSPTCRSRLSCRLLCGASSNRGTKRASWVSTLSYARPEYGLLAWPSPRIAGQPLRPCLPSLFARAAPPGPTNIPLTVGAITSPSRSSRHGLSRKPAGFTSMISVNPTRLRLKTTSMTDRAPLLPPFPQWQKHPHQQRLPVSSAPPKRNIRGSGAHYSALTGSVWGRLIQTP